MSEFTKTQITAVLEIDVRNPNDKLVFDVRGVADPAEKMILYVSTMYDGEVTRQFRSFAERGSLIIAILSEGAEDANVLHKFFSLWRTGEKVHKVKLSAKNPRISYAYATLNLSDVKVSSVVPVQGDSDRTFHLVNLSASGSNGVTTYS